MSPESGLFANIFLAIFLFGLIFTVVSLVLGVSHVGAVGGHDGAFAGGHNVELGGAAPHGGFHIGDLGHGGHTVDAGHAGHIGDVGHAGHMADAGHGGAHAQGGGADIRHADIHLGGHGAEPEAGLDTLPVLNMPTIMAFFTWFGGAGFIVIRTLGWGPVVAVPLALTSGLTGGTIMFFLLARVLWPMRSKPMSTAEYRLPGTAARVVSSIREGGVGEIVYTKAGTRFTAGARSEGNQPIAKGTEVVIVRYERGLAYVQAVDALLNSGFTE